MRSASRAWRSSASPTGSIRRPRLPRTCSASPTSTATAPAGSSARSTSYLSDPATRGKPLVLSISSRVQQALEAELGDAMQHFSAIGAAGVVMDVHTGEVLAMTSMPTFNPNAPGQGTPRPDVQPGDARRVRARIDLQAVHAGDGDGLGRRFRPGPDVSTARTCCPAYGHLVHDTHPFGRQLLGRRNHDGKLQHRHGADRRSARDRAAEGVAQEDGLPRQAGDRAAGNAAVR